MPSPARAEIVVDLAAIRHNVRLLRERVSGPRSGSTPVQMMTVVKADGYGHGMVPVARAAREAGAEWLGVATLDEALALRAAGDTGRVLCWLTVPGEDYAAALEAGVDLTAYSPAELDEIAAAVGGSGGEPARVQLKVDTGLHRGGAAREGWAALFERAAGLERSGTLRVSGVWSHFACADEPHHPANDAQHQAFEEALALAGEAGLRPEVRHLANSAATLLRPSAHYDLVRCGIASYGLDPAPGVTGEVGLRPAMTVRSRLAMVKTVPPGGGVSYGHTWTAEQETTLGLVPVGYGDGVPRNAGNAVSVWVEGSQRPVRGTVCMDQLLADLGGERPAPGAEVVLFGTGEDDTPTATDWALATGTINYEIVTRAGGRLTRRYLDPGPDTGPDTGSDVRTGAERTA